MYDINLRNKTNSFPRQGNFTVGQQPKTQERHDRILLRQTPPNRCVGFEILRCIWFPIGRIDRRWILLGMLVDNLDVVWDALRSLRRVSVSDPGSVGIATFLSINTDTILSKTFFSNSDCVDSDVLWSTNLHDCDGDSDPLLLAGVINNLIK